MLSFFFIFFLSYTETESWRRSQEASWNQCFAEAASGPPSAEQCKGLLSGICSVLLYVWWNFMDRDSSFYSFCCVILETDLLTGVGESVLVCVCVLCVCVCVCAMCVCVPCVCVCVPCVCAMCVCAACVCVCAMGVRCMSVCVCVCVWFKRVLMVGEKKQ